MKRREMLALAIAAPLAGCARRFPSPSRGMRAFADLRHDGSLVMVPAMPSTRDFGIAVPLPLLSDGGMVPETLQDQARLAPRLGAIRVESFDPSAELRVAANGDAATAAHLFRLSAGTWRRVAPAGAATWIIRPDAEGPTDLGVGIMLPTATAEAPQPIWPRALTLEIESSGTVSRVAFRVAPFIIPSALERGHEALIVSRASTAQAVADLRAWGTRHGVPVFALEAQDPCDQWMQDTIEPGVFAFPARGGAQQAPAIMTGQRREFGAAAAGLDRQIAAKLRERGVLTIGQSVPRPRTRWIDWFGNLEVSPPHTDRSGRRHPYGRLIAGTQRELSMHPDAMRFLEAQGMQWPPIMLDTSWLSIGHVDELINFVPARTAPGWKVLLPSPRAARDAMATLASGHDAGLVFAGTRDETTVAKLRADVASSEENVAIDAHVAGLREQLKGELSIGDADFAMVPCLFTRGRALIPNAVNCLAINGHLVATQPKGPRVEGRDIFEEAIRASLSACAVDITFIDAWRAYHQGAGEVHCGTNSFRRLADPAWWNHV